MTSKSVPFTPIPVDRRRIELLLQALFTHLDLIMTSNTLAVKDRVDRVVELWHIVTALKHADQLLTAQETRTNGGGHPKYNHAP